MKITIDLDATGASLEEKVSKKLEKSKLPICLGKMMLPILKKEVTIDDNNFKLLYPIKTVAQKNRIPVRGILLNGGSDEFCLTQKSIDTINSFKEKETDAYVNKIKGCIECKHSEICSKLTLNYLISISILVGGK